MAALSGAQIEQVTNLAQRLAETMRELRATDNDDEARRLSGHFVEIVEQLYAIASVARG